MKQGNWFPADTNETMPSSWLFVEFGRVDKNRMWIAIVRQRVFSTHACGWAPASDLYVILQGM
jgi:hypothetical protein